VALAMERTVAIRAPDTTFVRSKAPLRIRFCGGGTDVKPFSDDPGCVVPRATINWYAYGTLIRAEGHGVEVRSLDYGSSARYERWDDLVFDGKLDLVKSVIRRLWHDDGEIHLFLHSDAPPGSGLGSSSALVVRISCKC